MKITKAVIPAAGLGTRVLPASKAIPKEMLPIVDKPAIQYIVEEAVKSGITDILIITGRGKAPVEDHFDRSPELEAKLLQSGKQQEYDEMIEISKLANIQYIRQKETKGLGHAVYCAKSFAGNDPFVVLYGDDVIISETPVSKQLIDVYEKTGLGVVAMQQVSLDVISKYCTLDVEQFENNSYKVFDMIEKPTADQVMSNFAILGRCLLTPEIFDILENQAPGAGGEIQLTDAMKIMCKTKGMMGVDFIGKRYDMGSKLGILEAIVEVGAKHPEIGDEFRQYIKKFAKTI